MVSISTHRVLSPALWRHCSSSRLGLLFLVCFSLGSAMAGQRVRIENRFLAVEVAVRDGAIVSLSNKLARIELLSRVEDKRQPWLMLLDGNQFLGAFDEFSFRQTDLPDRQTLSLRWTTKAGIVVHAELALSKESNRLTLRSRAENVGERTILALNYPRLEGIGPLDENGARDRLLHATLGGALVRDPFHLFDAGARIPQGKGFLPCRYPNAFAGAPLQLMAYYTEEKGGFAVRVEDADHVDKDLNFFKAPENRSLLCEIAHFQQDARPGHSLQAGYPVVITAMTEGSWYEAAEDYRHWAIKQDWCKRGTRRQRVERGDAAAWLYDGIGAVGMWWPFDTDIREAVRLTRQAMGAPLLQFPLRWKDAPSVDAARAEGGRLGPFAFPFVALEGTPTFLDHAGDALVPRVTPVVKQWIGMCPAQPDWRKVFVEENIDLTGADPLRHHLVWNEQNLRGCEADALYFDVGPCAGLPTHCYASGHKHPPGAGAQITQAYASLIKEMQATVSQRRGRYIPIGTECVSEPFLDSLDLCYVRTAGLDPWMECLPYARSLTWLPDAQMETVPLWEFVYHEYGPLGMQGIYATDHWPVREGDDYWCWAEARTTLQGQVVVTDPLRPGVEVPAERIRFLRNMTATRTGFGRDYLAFGRMQRPPQVARSMVAIDHGLGGQGWLRQRIVRTPPAQRTESSTTQTPKGQRGTSVEDWIAEMMNLPATVASTSALRVPQVLVQAYTLDHRLGIFLINLHRVDAVRVRVPVRPSQYGLPESKYSVGVVRMSGRKEAGTVTDRLELEVELPPREFVLVEAR